MKDEWDYEPPVAAADEWDYEQPGIDTRIDMDAWQPVPEGQKDFGDQLLAGVSGFADTVTMGLGDETAAGLEAGAEWLGGSREDNLYQKHLDKGQAAREQLAGQYPTEFEQGEYTGMGTQMLTPSGAGKAAIGAGGKVVGGAKNVADKSVLALGDTVGAAVSKGPLGKLKDRRAFDATKSADTARDVEGMEFAQKLYETTMVRAAVDQSRMNAVGGVVKGFFPKTAVEATAQVIGHNIYPGGGLLAQTGVRTAKRKLGPAANAFNKKYGELVLGFAGRGAEATTANVFIKQQQDPEFRAMLKAAKDEAAQAAKEAE